MAARSFSVFQFIFGQFAVGDIASLAFIAGITFLVSKSLLTSRPGPTALQIAVFLLLPFAFNCALGILDVYPYGGTRHSVFLAIFAISGFSLCLATITRERKLWSITFAAGIVLLCWIFPSRHPYILRADQKREHMEQAIR